MIPASRIVRAAAPSTGNILYRAVGPRLVYQSTMSLLAKNARLFPAFLLLNLRLLPPYPNASLPAGSLGLREWQDLILCANLNPRATSAFPYYLRPLICLYGTKVPLFRSVDTATLAQRLVAAKRQGRRDSAHREHSC